MEGTDSLPDTEKDRVITFDNPLADSETTTVQVQEPATGSLRPSAEEKGKGIASISTPITTTGPKRKSGEANLSPNPSEKQREKLPATGRGAAANMGRGRGRGVGRGSGRGSQPSGKLSGRGMGSASAIASQKGLKAPTVHSANVTAPPPNKDTEPVNSSLSPPLNSPPSGPMEVAQDEYAKVSHQGIPPQVGDILKSPSSLLAEAAGQPSQSQ